MPLCTSSPFGMFFCELLGVSEAVEAFCLG